MALSIVTPPVGEPLSLVSAKEQVRGGDGEEGLLSTLITTSREYVESFTHRPLYNQTWALKLDGFGTSEYMRYDEMWLPLPPVSSVSSITYLDTAGATQTWSSANYRTDLPTGPYARRARITPAYGVSWPDTYPVTNAVTVTFVAGYGTTEASVPASLVHAMKLLVGHLFLNREAVMVGVGIGAVVVPTTIDALLWPFKAF